VIVIGLNLMIDCSNRRRGEARLAVVWMLGCSTGTKAARLPRPTTLDEKRSVPPCYRTMSGSYGKESTLGHSLLRPRVSEHI
jgi:hypothetical protein